MGGGTTLSDGIVADTLEESYMGGMLSQGEAMEEAAVKLGLPAETARRLAIQTALGASTMAQRSDKDPATLKQNVMSPGGTTERAIAHMEDAHLRTIIADAMQACAARADAMSKELSGND